MAQTLDFFRPRSEPASSIYDAFQDEASKRKGRRVEDWTAAELTAVHAAAGAAARAMSLREPTLDEVCAAERYARGSADYGAKWAYGLERCMRAVPAAATAVR